MDRKPGGPQGPSGPYGEVRIFYPPALLFKIVTIRTYNAIILPVVLYGCQTCSLAFTEEHGLRVFENSVLGRVGEDCIIRASQLVPFAMNNREDHIQMRWTGHVARFERRVMHMLYL
jgi:hypothetical protein